jgi:hypothetical protein
MRSIAIGSFVFVSLLAGCATSFTGDAHVENGPAGCQAKCQAWGQDFVGMVALGEYSDACICRVPGKQASIKDDASAVAGGAVGVMMQMRRMQSQQQQSMTYR